MATVRGYVTWVLFDPGRDYFTAIRVAAAPDTADDGEHQIDGGTFSIDGRPVDRATLLRWLVPTKAERRTVRVVLTGNFGSYPTCEAAEFFEGESK